MNNNSLIGRLINIDKSKAGKYVEIQDVVQVPNPKGGSCTGYLVCDSKGKDAVVVTPDQIVKFKKDKKKKGEEEDEDEE